MVGTPKFSGSFKGGKVVPSKGSPTKPSSPSPSSPKPSSGSSGNNASNKYTPAQLAQIAKLKEGTIVTGVDSSGNIKTANKGDVISKGVTISSGASSGTGTYYQAGKAVGTTTVQGNLNPAQKANVIQATGGQQSQMYKELDQQAKNAEKQRQAQLEATKEAQARLSSIDKTKEIMKYGADYRPTSLSESSTPQSVILEREREKPNTYKKLESSYFENRKPTFNTATNVFGDIPVMFSKGAESIFIKASQESNKQGGLFSNKDLSNIKVYGYLGLYGAAKFTEGVSDVVIHPVETGKGVLNFAYNIIINPAGTVGGVIGQIQENPIGTISYMAGQSKTLDIAGKSKNIIKDTYVATSSKLGGGRFVEPELVTTPEVLSGKETFPKTKSTAESLRRFNENAKTGYNLQKVQDIVQNPQNYRTEIEGGNIASSVLQDIQKANPKEKIVLTGGSARKIATGQGKVRDIDIVTNTGKEMAENTAKLYPEKYKVIQHEKYPEIYRLQEKSTNKVVADFDPVKLAEEGLINPKTDIIKAGQYYIVKPEVMLKSKATQIIKGKAKTLKQAENIKQLSGLDITSKEVTLVTASPSKIKGSEVIEIADKKGLQDPGIYTTPKGEASVYFTGLMGASEYKFSLNPFEGLFDIPSITEIKVSKVRTYPKEITSKPGFEAVKEFQTKNIGKGEAYITKRSQIGTGDIKAQEFILKEETTLGGKKIEAGTKVTESGTSEIEAVIGVGEKFKTKGDNFIQRATGIKGYTKIAGRNVAIREIKLLKSNEAIDITKGEKEVTGTKINKGTQALEVSSGKVKYITPKEVLPKFSNLYNKESKVSKIEISRSKYEAIKENIVSSSNNSNKNTSSNIISDISNKSNISRSNKEYSNIYAKSGISGGSSNLSNISGKSGTSKRYSVVSSKSSITSGSSFKSSSEQIRKKKIIESIYNLPSKKKKGGYKVQVRSKGQFKTIGIFETAQQALTAGKIRTQTTASASFKVQSESGANVNVNLPTKDFYKSKKEAGVIVQKRENRISTLGEKREITYKGIFANKQRKNIWG